MYIIAKNTFHVYSNTFENSFTSKITNKCYDMTLVSRRLTNNYLFWLAIDGGLACSRLAVGGVVLAQDPVRL